ncbi:MAG: hypothetical protein ACHBN1_27150 [Heteroscytonema crispum UTEX LB 1556]
MLFTLVVLLPPLKLLRKSPKMNHPLGQTERLVRQARRLPDIGRLFDWEVLKSGDGLGMKVKSDR